jgi:hypothetical protein
VKVIVGKGETVANSVSIQFLEASTKAKSQAPVDMLP